MIGVAKHGASGGKRRRFRRNCARDDAPSRHCGGLRRGNRERRKRGRDESPQTDAGIPL